MRINDLKSVLLRTTSVCLSLALSLAPAEAQLQSDAATRAPAAQTAQPPVAPVATPQPPRTILHIVVTGTQRVEPATVLTYVNIREGDPYDPATVDAALKAVQATGLFTGATRMDFNGATGTLTVHVTENPIVNQVVFEGNSKVSDKDLTKEIQLKARSVFTRAKVQADVARILEVYRRNGKFAARVDPQIISRPQNRVDLIFGINEGPFTGVSRINFIGNKVFDASTLRGQIMTEETSWYKILASNDNYDPDRLSFDKEMLHRFYTSHGYADFKVVSAVAQLTPGGKSFYINFTVDEGPKYKFGKVAITSKIPELPPAELRPLLEIVTGDTYDAEYLQKGLDTLTNAAGGKGYAFAQVTPRIDRNRDNHTIDVTFNIDQGPRVYIERIDITGNTRTLDKVIRREFRLVEGDAFNRVLIDRSRTRIRSLGFFSSVQINPAPGSQPDRSVVTVAVTEQSTGAIQVGVGYSSVSQLIGDISYTESNLFGRGQNLAVVMRISQIQKQGQLSFTEPWFLDRPLAAGFDLQKVITDYQEATFESDTTVASARLGFPISEYSFVKLILSYQIQQVDPFPNAPEEILLDAGKQRGLILGFTYDFNNLDDPRKPTKGVDLNLSQNYAGFGGTMKYIQSMASFSAFTPMFSDSMVGSFKLQTGYVTGYDGTPVPINNRFFEGGDTFRGFAYAGVGPRDVTQANNLGAVGGNAFAIGTVTERLPSLLPESYGINFSLFSDFGTDGHVDSIGSRACSTTSCVRDNFAFRGSAGLSVGWKSPFGPLNVDFGIPYARASYDREQIIHFSTAAGL